MVQSLGVELHDWRRRPAAFRWRRIKRQRLFVVGQRVRALNDPDMVLGIYGNAGGLSDDPVVGQRLGPCSVDRESRNVLGASHNRRQREGNECDIQFHHAHAIAIM